MGPSRPSGPGGPSGPTATTAKENASTSPSFRPRLRGHGDRFADLTRELYLIAVDLDDGKAVAFGEAGHRRVAVSKAVQASTALPGLYRPVRIAGRDYVDGGVKKTAHINRAIRHGARLVVCVNPIVRS